MSVSHSAFSVFLNYITVLLMFPFWAFYANFELCWLIRHRSSLSFKFCVDWTLGCDQKHDEEMDSEAIYKNFVLRVSCCYFLIEMVF